MNDMGSAALLVAFFVSAYGAAASLGGALAGRRDFVKSSELAVYLNLVLLTITSVALARALLARDFSLLYVFEYSSRSLSDAYAVTAFWAGQEGSLLLWAWLLALGIAGALVLYRQKLPDLMPWVTFILMVNSSFFLFLLNFVSHPFTPFPGTVPGDGYGLNPLLQNPGMIIHPPTLFIGYVGLTVTYAFAMAALLAGRSDPGWINHTRTWTVISWFFLGIGILLGAQWAYVELGWGGYWAWDPVENASLMPWLTATAFLHSAMVQKRRGIFRLWNMSLIITTYFLVIFGTFITRSGLISSVHAFGKNSLGFYFLVFMAVTLLLSLSALWWRRDLLTPENHLESVVSKEGAFLLTNLVFAVMAFSIFWGTVLPVLTEIARGVKITVGPGYYNKVNVPVALVLMTLMGACPLLAWRKEVPGKAVRHLKLPGALGAAGAAVAYAAGIRNLATVMVVALSALITGTILLELYWKTAAHRAATSDPVHLAVTRVILSARRRYGGYVVHLGMVLILLGISGAPMVQETRATVSPGEFLNLGKYTLQYLNMTWVPTRDRLAIATRLKAFRDGQPVGYLVPEKRFYANREDQPTSEVSILGNWKEDLYVALTGYNRDGRASFKVLINPLVPWLWAGGYVVGIGVFLGVWPFARREVPGSAEGGRL